MIWTPIEFKIYFYTLGARHPGLVPKRIMAWLDKEISDYAVHH